MERRSKRFSRRFRLSKNSKVEEVKGAMENGALTNLLSLCPKRKSRGLMLGPFRFLSIYLDKIIISVIRKHAT